MWVSSKQKPTVTLIPTRSTRPLQPFSARLHRVERAAGEDEEGLAVFAAEDEIDGTVWNFDGVDEFAGGVVDVDLSGGDVDVAFGILRDAFASLLGEKLGIGEGSVGCYGATKVFCSDSSLT